MCKRGVLKVASVSVRHGLDWLSTGVIGGGLPGSGRSSIRQSQVRGVSPHGIHLLHRDCLSHF
jgi:hypothetical protein